MPPNQSGESNWLLGMMLIVAYIIIAAGFWEHKDENLQNIEGVAPTFAPTHK